MKNKIEKILYVGLLLLALLVHIIYLYQGELYGDEIVALFYANSFNFKYLFTHLVEVTNPNGYYIFLKILANLFPQVVYIKIFSFCMFLLSGVALFKIAQLYDFNHKQKILFFLPFFSSLYFLRFNYMLRMYGVGILLFLLSLYLFLRWYKKGERKKLLISNFVDIIGLSFVYGYVLWIVLKILLLFILKKRDFQAIKFNFFIFPIMTILSFGIFFIKIYFLDLEGFNRHLGWVKPPDFFDFGLSFLNLSGFNFFNYFEGFGAISTSTELLGLVVSFLLLFFLFLRVKFNKMQLKIWSIFDLLFVFSIILLFVFFVVNFLGRFHFFHIRQMFVLASIFSLYYGYQLATNEHKLFCKILIPLFPIFMIFNYQKVFYPRFFLPQREHNEIVIINKYNTDVGYYLCNATSYQEIVDLCPSKNVLFDLELTDTKENSTEFLLFIDQFASNTKLNQNCTEETRDFYRCSTLRR